jgi:hypothetical protein
MRMYILPKIVKKVNGIGRPAGISKQISQPFHLIDKLGRPGSAGVHARYGNNISHLSIKSLRHRAKRYQSNIDRLAGVDARAPREKTLVAASAALCIPRPALKSMRH